MQSDEEWSSFDCDDDREGNVGGGVCGGMAIVAGLRNIDDPGRPEGCVAARYIDMY